VDEREEGKRTLEYTSKEVPNMLSLTKDICVKAGAGVKGRTMRGTAVELETVVAGGQRAR
jgi:hypothetical protein